MLEHAILLEGRSPSASWLPGHGSSLRDSTGKILVRYGRTLADGRQSLVGRM